MNITASYIRRKLQGRYDPREAGNLSRIICCEILGQQTVDYYLGKDIILSVKEERSEERRVGKECRSRWSPYH